MILWLQMTFDPHQMQWHQSHARDKILSCLTSWDLFLIGFSSQMTSDPKCTEGFFLSIWNIHIPCMRTATFASWDIVISYMSLTLQTHTNLHHNENTPLQMQGFLFSSEPTKKFWIWSKLYTIQEDTDPQTPEEWKATKTPTTELFQQEYLKISNEGWSNDKVTWFLEKNGKQISEHILLHLIINLYRDRKYCIVPDSTSNVLGHIFFRQVRQKAKNLKN